MSVVVWCWNQSNISLGVCLVGTGDRTVNGFLLVGLVYRKDVWVSVRGS
jgi:hypothetical protein